MTDCCLRYERNICRLDSEDWRLESCKELIEWKNCAIYMHEDGLKYQFHHAINHSSIQQSLPIWSSKLICFSQNRAGNWNGNVVNCWRAAGKCSLFVQQKQVRRFIHSREGQVKLYSWEITRMKIYYQLLECFPCSWCTGTANIRRRGNCMRVVLKPCFEKWNLMRCNGYIAV